MAKFVLDNNIFGFNSKVYWQKSATTMRPKFAPPYASIYMDEIQQNLLETQSKKLLIWLRCIGNISFIWTYGKQELEIRICYWKRNKKGSLF